MIVLAKKWFSYDQTSLRHWYFVTLWTYSIIFLPKNFRRALAPLWSSSYGGELAKVATFCNKVIFLFPSCIWWTSQWIVINVDGFGRKYLLDEPGAKFRPLPEFDGIWWWQSMMVIIQTKQLPNSGNFGQRNFFSNSGNQFWPCPGFDGTRWAVLPSMVLLGLSAPRHAWPNNIRDSQNLIWTIFVSISKVRIVNTGCIGIWCR